MKGKRLWQTFCLCLIPSATKRAAYLRRHGVFAGMGEDCLFMGRIVPLYPELIRFGRNVSVASKVTFVTHDVTHRVLNRSPRVRELLGEEAAGRKIAERKGCIEVGDDVFLGAGSLILPDVRIGSQVILGAGSVVTKDIPSGSVAAGVPAKVIGSFDEFARKAASSARPATAEELWAAFEEKRN